MSLSDAVAEVFAPQGLLARQQGFMPREGQTRMALAVAQTLHEGGALVVEAGTGVGKTYAYLVPLLLSGKRALVSTATKNLQDQLFARDLPRLLQLLGLPIRLALLKGRSSYLCLHRMKVAREEIEDPSSSRTLARVEQWAQVTRSGDVAELPGLDERSALLPRITSTRENCLGSRCPDWGACHVNAARREAMAADLVVINHHLFFADLAVRKSGVAEMLPGVDAIIFDEAHQLNDIGVQFLGQQLSSAQWLDFARDVYATALAQARGMADWHALVRALENSLQHTRSLLGQGQHRWMGEAPQGVHPGDWQEALDAMVAALQAVHAALGVLSETSPDLARLAERAQTLRERLQGFMQPVSPGHVRWIDAAQSMRWVDSPLDISQAMRSLVQPGAVVEPAAAQDRSADEADGPHTHTRPDAATPSTAKSWVFTSATMGDEPTLSWFTKTSGLVDARTLQVPSPFDYARMAAIWVPADLPAPSEGAHPRAISQCVREIADVLGGRTLVLTTTLKSMRLIAQYLREQPARWVVLLQGESPKRDLTERFSNPSRGSVLVASASFWEGVDVPGPALQCVVIDKLPFAPPGDPLMDARAEQLTAKGLRPFVELGLPHAAIALKQGAGRLIRSETDQGLLVLGDTRLLTMSYGRRLLAALPPMRRLQTRDEAMDALQAITRTATTPFA